jgi:hypothetical protein
MCAPRVTRHIIAAVNNIYSPMLTRVWQVFEYRIDRVSRCAHIEKHYV